MLRTALRTASAGLAAGLFLVAGSQLSAQVMDTDWTERPDAHAPAGLLGDRLPGAGALDFRLRVEHTTFQDILVGRDQVAPFLVLQEWSMAALERTRQRVTAEVTYGITDGIAVSARAPFVRNEVTFATFERAGTVTNAGVGDVEIHALATVHRTWPVRAHVGFGVAIPTGSVDATGSTPDQPAATRVLPYDLQTGAGVLSLLPTAQVALENRYGTTGVQVEGRVSVGENNRDWAPGNSFRGNLFMQTRLNDWLGVSARVSMENTSTISGADPNLDPFASPLHWPTANGGSRVEIPVGMNLRFAEGGLEGHRLKAELVVPVHSDLNGPQLRSNWGAAIQWGYTLGGRP
jgi:hypothetical protein